MNVELTIQCMFDEYPMLFKERADCLNHLFCTLGNGYEWVNGELVYDKDGLTDEDVKRLSARLVDGKAYQHNKLSLRAEAQLNEEERINIGWYDKWHKKFPEDNIEEMKRVRQLTIMRIPDNEYYKERDRRKRWYFYVNIPGHETIDFCEDFVPLFNYPDNITPDWKSAIAECKLLLSEDGFELPEPKHIKELIDAMANYGRKNNWCDSEIIEMLVACGITKEDFVECGYGDYVREYFDEDEE